MAFTNRTFFLNENWDVDINENGNIIFATESYAIAQNVANNCRLHTQDAYFEQTRGIPWFLIQQGKKFAPILVKSKLRKSAMEVDGVMGVESIELKQEESRVMGGEITLAMQNGSSVLVEI